MAERVPIWYEARGGQCPSAAAHASLQTTATKLQRELELSIAIAYAVDTGEEIKCVASSGPAAPPIGTAVDPYEGICATCARQNRLQLSNDTTTDPLVSKQLCEGLGIRSILAVPLRRDSHCVGFLAAFSSVPHRFDVPLLERMRNEAGIIEAQLTRKPVHRFTLVSARPQTLDLRSQSSALRLRDYGEEMCSSQNLWDRAIACAKDHRSASIATLVSCALFMTVFFPAVVRSKTSRSAHLQAAANAQALAPSSQTKAAKIEPPSGSVDSSIRQLRKLANQGDVHAQKLLAARYEIADGIPRDSIKSCVWYIIAGANGDSAAKQRAVQISRGLAQHEIAQIRFNVGKMYMDGIGVPRDLVSAYSWFALAQAAADIRAQAEQEKLESKMTPEQISEGLRRASDWLLAHRTHGVPSRTVLASVSTQSR